MLAPFDRSDINLHSQLQEHLHVHTDLESLNSALQTSYSLASKLTNFAKQHLR